MSLTRVDKELVGDARVVHVVDGSSKKGSKYLQVCEHSLGARRRGEGAQTEMGPLRDPISKTKVLISALRRKRQMDLYE